MSYTSFPTSSCEAKALLNHSLASLQAASLDDLQRIHGQLAGLLANRPLVIDSTGLSHRFARLSEMLTAPEKFVETTEIDAFKLYMLKKLEDVQEGMGSLIVTSEGKIIDELLKRGAHYQHLRHFINAKIPLAPLLECEQEFQNRLILYPTFVVKLLQQGIDLITLAVKNPSLVKELFLNRLEVEHLLLEKIDINEVLRLQEPLKSLVLSNGRDFANLHRLGVTIAQIRYLQKNNQTEVLERPYDLCILLANGVVFKHFLNCPINLRKNLLAITWEFHDIFQDGLSLPSLAKMDQKTLSQFIKPYQGSSREAVTWFIWERLKAMELFRGE